MQLYILHFNHFLPVVRILARCSALEFHFHGGSISLVSFLAELSGIPAHEMYESVGGSSSHSGTAGKYYSFCFGVLSQIQLACFVFFFSCLLTAYVEVPRKPCILPIQKTFLILN